MCSLKGFLERAKPESSGPRRWEGNVDRSDQARKASTQRPQISVFTLTLRREKRNAKRSCRETQGVMRSLRRTDCPARC